MLIRRGRLRDGHIVDIRVGERIREIADRLDPQASEQVVDADGGAVLPGLHDHHLHLRAMAAALDSLTAGPPQVRTKAQLSQALRAAQPGPDGWIRAVGYHVSVAGELDRDQLDALLADTPVRIQHRSGAMWILNSAALSRVGLADHSDGRLFSADDWADALPQRATAIADITHRLARYGVTGITDATPDLTADDVAALSVAHRLGEIPQRLHFLAPGKRILHDDRLDVDELTGWIGELHDNDRPVALHCVTRDQLIVALAALRAAGSHPRDRIEHAAVVPDDMLAELVGVGVTVVTQPNFVAERGEHYLQDVPVDEQPQLWRVASLLRAGIPVAASTDAPFGGMDPWASMRAAVHRTTAEGDVLGAQERISPREALQLFLGHPGRPAIPRSVAVGQPGDLMVLAATAEVETLASDMVTTTIVGGRVSQPRPAAADGRTAPADRCRPQVPDPPR
ncbi:amidohydrolase family protein [Mycobacterium sp. 1274761.0]|uniref:amidohydrolase family protein n=1 Tax=Mycobacterium sp. 1274761.0 TaxID=1834077 RepID=UPI0007FF2807|nr:amidohydrolase family protein [Mycobacterium sp. 1274761.0]OBK70246.1 amidohydrolase [Mycobacterium sp. 1274761.0]